MGDRRKICPWIASRVVVNIRIFPLAGGPDAHELCGECTQMWLAGMDPRGVDEHSKSAGCWYTRGVLERCTCSGYPPCRQPRGKS